MKRKWHHPPKHESNRVTWRSTGELENSEEFQDWLGREFPQGAAEFEADETSRRNFVKLMGASTALAGFGVSCSRPLQHLVPYNEHVEWVIPGKSLYYSSAKPRLDGIGCDPLVVTTYSGRPTKVDGNKLHPASSGGSSSFTQASILELYDPDRSKGYLQSGKPSSKKAFEEGLLPKLQGRESGKGLAFLLPVSSSPTRNRLLKEVGEKFAGASVYSYSALEGKGAIDASKELYGAGKVAVPKLAKAEKILSLDCDFLGAEPVGEDSVAEFSRGRKVDGKKDAKMNRLYAAEAVFTVTGGMADHRYRIAPSQILPLAVLVASELGEKLGNEGLKQAVSAVSAKVNPTVFNLDWIKECAADLAASAGKSIVLVGARHSKEVQLLVAAINSALGAYGPLISVVDHKLPEMGSLGDLVKNVSKIDTLVICGEGDPVFDAPSDYKFGDVLKGIGTTVHIGPRVNETAKASTWHVPGTHYLEAWGDFWSHSGIYSVQQPMIDPLWGGVSEIEFLLSILTDAPAAAPTEGEGAEAGAAETGAAEEVVETLTALDAVKQTYSEIGGTDWVATLRDGFANGPKLKKAGATVDASLAGKALAKVEVADLPYPEAIEVALTVSGACYDGRFSNNGWLQEAPDAITKLTWDNAALISFGTAEALGLKDEDLVELSVDGRSVTVPVLASPGHADYTITLPVGYYGDLGAGSVNKGVGFNVYPLATSESSYVVTGVSVAKTGAKHEFALAAEHYSMEGRAIAREGTMEMFEEDKSFAQHQGMDHHIPENISLYKGYQYQNIDEEKEAINERNQVPALDGHAYRVDPLHQWAMTIDLHSCTGCNACLVACQAENNIPIVGKKQVIAGREMHWIRMDRYFTSPTDYKTVAEQGANKKKVGIPGRRKVDDDQVEMIPQPVACQQCEAAPCETVCPVNATVHTGDGLNAMTYNRCIGTRYCANNCPYKARRFNYYDYNKRPLDQLELGPLAPAAGRATTTLQLQKNPNVTVRMRGVIEKCTYCVQRISEAKIAAKAAARDSSDIQVKANSFTVACQDACSAGAIDFGNLNNGKDSIVKSKANSRNYDLLKYIGTLPRTSYLARIKNPNPKMPGADQIGTVTSKMH